MVQIKKPQRYLHGFVSEKASIRFQNYSVAADRGKGTSQIPEPTLGLTIVINQLTLA